MSRLSATNRLSATSRLSSAIRTAITNFYPLSTLTNRYKVDDAGVADFEIDLKNSIVPRFCFGLPTFTRATTATVTDFEGRIKNVKSGEARFEGARRVENLLTYSEDFSNAVWTKQSGNTVTSLGNGEWALDLSIGGLNKGVYNAGTGAYYYGDTATISFEAKASSPGTISISASVGWGTPAYTTVNLTTVWTRYSVSQTIDFSSFSGTKANGLWFINQSGNITSFSVRHVMEEKTAGQANQNPSEYVSTNVKTSAPYHGANVDGVKYFTTYNGNTVASNVVTEATGAAIPDATLHGYLAEGARTNLALQSEAFDNATYWGFNADCSISANQATSPAGTLTVDKLVESSNTNGRYVYQVITGISSGATLTSSVYVKAAGRTFVILYEVNSNVGRYFDLSNGTVGNVFVGAPVASSITSVGNGWYRVSITYTIPSTTSSFRIYPSLTGNSASYQGDGTSGLYLWGAQLETAGFASSYIPTTTASVTRNADSLTYQSAGNVIDSQATGYVESKIYSLVNSDRRALALTGLNNNRAHLIADAGNGITQFVVGTGSATSSTGSTATTLNVRKTAFRWNTSGVASFFVDGTKLADATGANIITTIIDIGAFSIGSPLYGTIRNVKLWKYALTDTQLIAITSNTN